MPENEQFPNPMPPEVEEDLADLADHSLGGAPRIDRVTCTYFRKGKCAACGQSGVERTQNFSGTTMEMCEEQAAVWMRTPLVHKKCEGRV